MPQILLSLESFFTNPTNHSKSFIFFILIGVLINLDRLILGEYSSFRILDTSEMYIDKVNFLRNFWIDPLNFSWNSLTLKGWPTDIGSINPNHFLVFLALFMEIEYAFITFFVISDILILFGMYLLCKEILGMKQGLSILSAILYLSSHYWYNVNLIETLVVFLPILIVALNFQTVHLNIFLRILLIFVIISSTYPPYIVPLMPLVHLVFIALNKNKFGTHFTTHIITFLIFWVLYLIFHLNSISEMLMVLDETNRALWVPDSDLSFLSFKEQLMQNNFSYLNLLPILFVLVFTQRRNLNSVVLMIVVSSVFLLLQVLLESREFNHLKQEFPIIQTTSFVWARINVLLGPTIVFCAIYMLKKTSFKKLELSKISFLLLFLLSALFFVHSSFLVAIMIGLFGILHVIFIPIYNYSFEKKNIYLLIFILIAFLLPFKAKHQYFREMPGFGFIFMDTFEYPSKSQPYRVLSLMDTSHSQTLFPAQIKIKNIEVLDGFSVIYDDDDAIAWQENVASHLTNPPFKFSSWNNTIEITADDFKNNIEIFLPFLRINNVELIRSPLKIQHPSLELTQEKTFNYPTWESTILNREKMKKNVFLYKLDDSLNRAFSNTIGINKMLEMNTKEWKTSGIPLINYSPSRLSFEYQKKANEKIYISSNFHPNWQLRINGVIQNRLQKSELGFIEIDPIDGRNIYDLSFIGKQKNILLNMFISFILATFLTLKITRIYPSNRLDNQLDS
jgi:hypothetical protein